MLKLILKGVKQKKKGKTLKANFRLGAVAFVRVKQCPL